MDRRLINLDKKVKGSAKPFNNYLCQNLPNEVLIFLENLKSLCEVYIFSGLIRNFFLGVKSFRDLDIVIDKPLEINELFKDFKIVKNSFGGYKIEIESINIDLWSIQQTWTVKKKGVLDLNLENYIPGTAFFNFSAIIYSLNKNKFIYGKDFLNFLNTKEIDIVNELNPNDELCIVNTFYYSERYSLKISQSLKKYILKLYYKHNFDYQKVQIKHFNKILYSNIEIETRILNFRDVEDPLVLFQQYGADYNIDDWGEDNNESNDSDEYQDEEEQ